MWLSRAVLRIPVQYISGIIADKYNRKNIIVLTNLISVPLAFLFIFIDSNNLWICYLLAFLLQSLNDIDMCSENALLPELVTKEDLSYANSVFSFLSSITIFLAPAIGGLIYKLSNNKVLFIINSVSFLISGILFLFIRYKYQPKENLHNNTGIFKMGIDGYKILKSFNSVKVLFICMSFYAILGRFYDTFKVLISDNLLNLGPEGIIYFSYSLAIGGLFSPFIVKYLKKYNILLLFILISSVISIAYIIFGYSSNMIISFLCLLTLGATQSLQGIYSKTIIQDNISKEYIGRVFSFYKMLLTLFAIIGLIIASPLYNFIGVGSSFLIISVLSILLNIKLFSSNKKAKHKYFSELGN